VKLKVILEAQPEGGYTIYCPAFPGCVSQGETKREAVENFLDALEGWLAVKAKVMAKQPAGSGRRRVKREVVEVIL